MGPFRGSPARILIQEFLRTNLLEDIYFSGGSAGEAEVEVEGAEVAVAVGSGAPLPAVPDPKPSLLSDTASIFPVGFSPFLS